MTPSWNFDNSKEPSTSEVMDRLAIMLMVNEIHLRALDALVTVCIADDGSFRAPSKADVIAARRLLPSRFKNTLEKPKA